MSEARLVGGLEHRGAPHAQRFLRMAGVRSVEVSTVEASGAEVRRGGERRGGEAWMQTLSAQRGGCGAEGAAGEQNGGLSRHS